MAQTPESRAIALVEAEASIHARYAEDVAASERLHAARLAQHAHDRDAELARLSTVALELLRHTLKLDEREPEPPKRKRGPRDTSMIPAERVEELLATPVPAFADAIRELSLNPLRQILIAADARELVAHVATLKREIGGRS